MLKQCSCTTSANSGAVHVVFVTQPGSALYHTQLCPERYGVSMIEEVQNGFHVRASEELPALLSKLRDLVCLRKGVDTPLRFCLHLIENQTAESERRNKGRTHFMPFAGVIWPNILKSSSISKYAVSLSSTLLVAVPKYSLRAAKAARFNSDGVAAVEESLGGVARPKACKATAKANNRRGVSETSLRKGRFTAMMAGRLWKCTVERVYL